MDKNSTDSPQSLKLTLDPKQIGDEQFNDTLNDCFKPLADLNRLKKHSSPNDSGQLAQIYNLGHLNAFHLRTDSLLFRRNKSHIGKSELDEFLVLATYQGGKVHVSTDQQATIRSGDTVLYDLEKTIVGHSVDGFEASNILIPKHALHQHGFDITQKGAVFIPGTSPTGAIIKSTILNLNESVDYATSEQLLSASNALPGMLSHLLAPDKHSEQSELIRAATRATIMEYIDQNLENPELTPATLAKVFHRSRATLYRLFSDQGGILNYILRRRLHASYLEIVLSSPSERIIDIAVKWGFNNHSHYTRLFRDHYGLTPSSLLEAAMANELDSVNKMAKQYNQEMEANKHWMLHYS